MSKRLIFLHFPKCGGSNFFWNISSNLYAPSALDHSVIKELSFKKQSLVGLPPGILFHPDNPMTFMGRYVHIHNPSLSLCSALKAHNISVHDYFEESIVYFLVRRPASWFLSSYNYYMSGRGGPNSLVGPSLLQLVSLENNDLSIFSDSCAWYKVANISAHEYLNFCLSLPAHYTAQVPANSPALRLGMIPNYTLYPDGIYTYLLTTYLGRYEELSLCQPIPLALETYNTLLAARSLAMLNVTVDFHSTLWQALIRLPAIKPSSSITAHLISEVSKTIVNANKSPSPITTSESELGPLDLLLYASFPNDYSIWERAYQTSFKLISSWMTSSVCAVDKSTHSIDPF